MKQFLEKLNHSRIGKHYILSLCLWSLLIWILISSRQSGWFSWVMWSIFVLSILSWLARLVMYIIDWGKKKIKQYFPNKYEEYENYIIATVKSGIFDDENIVVADKILTTLQASKNDVKKINKRVFTEIFKKIVQDGKISTEELNFINKFINYCEVDSEELNFNQEDFNKFYTLGLIDEWKLPNITDQNTDLNLQSDEILHRLCGGVLIKEKKITERINYWWFTGSIKIAKWVRYRYWSIKTAPSVRTVNTIHDEWYFWLSSKRIWFKWTKKHFNVLYSKILSFQLTNKELLIFKDWKEIPYSVTLTDYEVPSAIVSFMLNKLA